MSKQNVSFFYFIVSIKDWLLPTWAIELSRKWILGIHDYYVLHHFYHVDLYLCNMPKNCVYYGQLKGNHNNVCMKIPHIIQWKCIFNFFFLLLMEYSICFPSSLSNMNGQIDYINIVFD